MPASRSMQDRVAQAYHDYGRFCSAHPYFCITSSILTMLFLSYPAVVRFKLPASSPIDVHWNDKPTVDANDNAPQWVHSKPTMFLQQIVVRSGVEPWSSSNMTTDQSIRGPLSRAFRVRDAILNHEGVDDACVHVSSNVGVDDDHSTPYLLPKRGCLLLSPTAFWHHTERLFREDSDIAKTIFREDCLPSMCVREMLLGMPTGMSGLKLDYRTNRKRSIDYILTLFLVEYNPQLRSGLRSRLSQDFSIVDSSAADENTFVYVFYRPRRIVKDYLPLTLSFVVFLLYVYYSSRKFEMVASRWGLAFAAVFTVAATLLIATGITAHLGWTPTLWGAEIYPYIALILGLENILCITRSVVYTSPSLDVSSRLSHGLSQEGYSLCKYFVMEIAFLGLGYLTGVSEICEFCSFAFIGLIVDFYMQLFFYAPCLTFDLLRLKDEDKQRFAMMLFSSEIPRLKNYPPVSCPMRKFLPSLFEGKKVMKRRLSDSQLAGRERDQLTDSKNIRRSASLARQEEDDGDWLQSIQGRARSTRLKILNFVSRTRIIQRTMIVVFVAYTIWMAFIVHSKRSHRAAAAANDEAVGLGVSHRILETAPQEWGEWQRRTFRWWPVLFSEYNMSISGGYITFLPPIVLSTAIPPTDPYLFIEPTTKKADYRDGAKMEHDPVELQSRIYSLEKQLTMVLAAFLIVLIGSVLSFLAYACFSDRLERFKNELRGWGKGETSNSKPLYMSPARSTGGRNAIESLPVIFSGHRFPIECIVVESNRVISACQEGKVLVWNIETGQRLLRLLRLRVAPPPANEVSSQQQSQPQIWCIAAQKDVIFLGCADGALEVACAERNKLIGVYQQSKVGIIHVKVVDELIVLAKLDGTIEFVEISLTKDKPTKVTMIRLIGTVKAHQKPISRLLVKDDLVVTASSDHSVKVFDMTSRAQKFALVAHNAPVCDIHMAETDKLLFSSCEDGVVCWWSLASGDLLRFVDIKSKGPSYLTMCTDKLLVYTAEGTLNVFDKVDGSRLSQLTANKESESPVSLLGIHCIAAITSEVVAVSYDRTVVFWDLPHNAIIRQVEVESSVERIIAVDSKLVLCQGGNSLFRINSPVVWIK